MVDNKITRATAIKIAIIELIKGEYIQEKEHNPNYLKTNDGRAVYRINTLGIIASKDKVGSMTNLLLDDGTGQMIIRFFEENSYLENINLGDILVVIGKIRVFNNEKYISPEIAKKTSQEWLKIRLVELKSKINYLTYVDLENKNLSQEIKNNPPKNQPKNIFDEKVADELEDEIVIKDSLQLPIDKILQLIKELDKGDGAIIEDVLEKSTVDDPERILEKLLEKGDIFQNQPGKVKVL